MERRQLEGLRVRQTAERLSAMPGSIAVISALAARVRLLETRFKNVEQVKHDPAAESIISTASEVHGMLCQVLNKNIHSLIAAVRMCAKVGAAEPELINRLARLARSADAVRHTAKYDLSCITAELAASISGW